MSIFDDFVEVISDGADAIGDVISDVEEAIDDAMEEAARMLLEEFLESAEEFFTQGGSEVDNNEFEERSNIGSSSSALDVSRLIPIELTQEHGHDSDELTLVPPQYTSHLGETDEDSEDVHAVTDGTLDTYYSATLADSLRYIQSGTTYTPDWTNFNDSDPSATMADGGLLDDINVSDDGSSNGETTSEVDPYIDYGFYVAPTDTYPTLH